MGIEDFERCTPSEFAAIAGQWRREREAEERGAWERARLTCLCILQPYSRRALRARDVMEFPWDAEGEAEASPGRELSRAEVMERYRRAKAAAGLTAAGDGGG